MKTSTRWSRRGSSGRRNWTIPLLITAAGLAALRPCFAQEPPTPAGPAAAPPPAEAAPPAPPPAPQPESAPPPPPAAPQATGSIRTGAGVYPAAPLPAPPSPPSEPATPGQVGSGFVVQVGVTTAPAIFDDHALLSLTSVVGTLMLGYKWERVVLGVGLDLARLSTANKYDHGAGTGSNETTVTSFLVYPALQVAFARSEDQRAELFGGLQVGVGSVATSREQESESPGPDPEPPPEAPSTMRLGFRLGLGVRYWAHPHVGISVMGGLGTDYYATSEENSESSVALTGMFGSFGLIGAF